MARQKFGGGAADWVFQFGAGGVLGQMPSAVVTLWNSLSGGTQYGPAPMPGGVDDGTGLVDATLAPIGSVTCDTNGEIPDSFYGPDNIFKMAADASTGGTGPRRWIFANSIAEQMSALATQQSVNVTQLTFLNSVAPVFNYYNPALPGYPPRPATGAPVWWVGPVAPAFGGTGAVDGLDYFLGPQS